MRGKNVLLTGGAGTGKTVVLREAVKQLEQAGKTVLVCAPTGVAAVHIGGTTIHNLFGFPASSVINVSETHGYTLMTRAPALIRQADVIIIDEISMVRCDLFDAIAASIWKAERIAEKHIQLIVAGDFFQLPPVIKANDTVSASAFYGHTLSAATSYAFQGINWRKFHFYPVILSQCMRQNNAEFIHNLNLLRVGDPSCMTYFNQRYTDIPVDGVKIFARKSDALKANQEEMDRLPGNSCTLVRKIVYESGFSVKDLSTADLDALPSDLTLKIGARVIMTANNMYGTKDEIVDFSPSFHRHSAECPVYVNGSTGTVLEVGTSDEHGNVESLVVNIDRGETIICDRIAYPIFSYRVNAKDKTKIDRVLIATCWQYPVIPAYAVTIHRSQGQTYATATINPSSFAAGQLYVALSRVRTLEGLTLTRRITKRDIRVEKAVQTFYQELEGKGHRGRPPIQDKRKAKEVIMWVPAPLEAHVRSEIQKGHPLKLSRYPAYSSERIHIRIPNALSEHVAEEIVDWRSKAKAGKKRGK